MRDHCYSLRQHGLSLLLCLPLAACGGINLWPFGGEAPEQTVVLKKGPENAVEYRCDGGKSFHVRLLDGGGSVWVFLPDRQVRLDRVAGGAGGRYGNGLALLQIGDAAATLDDGPGNAYSGCQQVGAKP